MSTPSWAGRRGADESPIETIVGRLDPSVAGGDWVSAITGLPGSEMADLAALTLAHSHEAQVFLELMSATVRQLQSTTTMRTERCVGHVRGPILWSETITAWSSGIGADDVFICMAPSRDYDLAENRMVAWLLHRLGRSTRHLDTAASMRFDEQARAEIAHNAMVARRWLAHRHLAEVDRRRPRAADLRKARSTRHPRPYEPAFALATRAQRPFVADEVEDLLDVGGAALLQSLVWVIDAIESTGTVVPPLRVSGQALGAGRLVFRHPRHFPGEMSGIEVAGVLIDAASSPDPATVADARARLAVRAAGRPFCLVTTPEEAMLAVELARGLEIAR